jgi:hypothetical protein
VCLSVGAIRKSDLHKEFRLGGGVRETSGDSERCRIATERWATQCMGGGVASYHVAWGGGDVGAQGRQSKHRRREGRFEAGSRS